jgi:histidinol-phosphate aminotransferase
MNDSVFVRHANPCVSDVRAYVPGPTAGMISARHGIPVERIVKLSSNEAPLGPSPRAREALRAIAGGDDLHRYPAPYPTPLIEAMARAFGVAPRQVLPAGGSSETWSLIVRAFSAPGDEVLAFEPSMTSYAEVAVMAERRARVIDMAPPFSLSAADVLAAVRSETRVVFVCSPNNTTSRMLEPGEIAAIAHGAPGAVIVVDEHYIEAADDYRRRTALTLLGAVPNLIVTRSLSKMYGLAGLRVGAAVGPEAAVGFLRHFRSKWSVSLAAAAAGTVALLDEEHLADNVAMTRAGREALVRALGRLHGVELVPEAQGGFLLFRPLTRPSLDVVEELGRSGVMVRGDLLDGYIRVSVGTPEQNQAFLDALEAGLRVPAAVLR